MCNNVQSIASNMQCQGLELFGLTKYKLVDDLQYNSKTHFWEA